MTVTLEPAMKRRLQWHTVGRERVVKLSTAARASELQLQRGVQRSASWGWTQEKLLELQKLMRMQLQLQVPAVMAMALATR